MYRLLHFQAIMLKNMINCLNELKTGKSTILFLGDSISDGGRYISLIHTYFRLFLSDYDISIRNLGVSSETVSGLSEPDHPFPRPCALGRVDRVLEEIHPDWVVTCYGINDGIYYPFSSERLEKYKSGYTELVKRIHQSGAKVAVMTPPPFDTDSFVGELSPDGEEKYSYMKPYYKYCEVMRQYADWVRAEMPSQAECVIDMYSALYNDITENRKSNPAYLSGDGIHPNLHGHFVMADAVLRELFSIFSPNFEACMKADGFVLADMMHKRDDLLHCYDKELIGHDNAFKSEHLEKDELIPALNEHDEQISEYIKNHNELLCRDTEWNGFVKHCFHFDGYDAIVVEPRSAAKNRPYAWRTEFFGAFPQADIDLLEMGWHIVHLSIPNKYGCPAAVSEMARFQPFVEGKYNLNKKAVLFGFSRGGLYAIHYAAAFPERISALYLDAPVVDIMSWPAKIGVNPAWSREWRECLYWFDLSQETAQSYGEILSRAVETITFNKLPLIIVAGDSDEVVPFEENGRLLCEAYGKAGIDYKLILKQGIGHHPHSLEDAKPITLFLLDNCL